MAEQPQGCARVTGTVAGQETNGSQIDPDGVIQAMEVLTPPVGRKFAESAGRSRPTSMSARRAARRPLRLAGCRGN
jgi:hypothetical protein